MFDIYSANEWSTKKRKDFLCDQLKNWPSLFNFLNQKDFCCMPLPNIYPTLLLGSGTYTPKSYNSYEPYVEKRRESLAYRTTSRYLDFG